MFIKGFNDKDIFTYIWDEVKIPKGVIQIFHGMCEHAKRYSDFANFLNQEGFIVYANDHLGHGKTAGEITNLGYIGPDGFNHIVEDEHLITKLIQNTYPSLPIIVLGHSFGSFVAQEYLTRYSNQIHAMILSGSAMQKGLQITLGSLIASIQYHLSDERKPDNLLTLLSFGTYNKKFTDSVSAFRWLSSDKNEVEKYEKDPYCGTVFSINFYYYLFKGFNNLYKKNRLVQIRKDIALLIVSGDMDPVGNYGKSVTKLHKFYTQLNLQDTTLKFFPARRHEILNEVNKHDVYTYLLEWINKKM
jgi:alpha-beta hydrolase superfamily lysophospholipase